MAADEDGDEAGEADVHVAEVEAGGEDGADTEGVGEAGEGGDEGDELEEAGDEADAEVEADDDEDVLGDRVVAVQDCQGGGDGGDGGEVEGEDGEDGGDPHRRAEATLTRDKPRPFCPEPLEEEEIIRISRG